MRGRADKRAAFASMAKWYGITDSVKQEAIHTTASELPSKPFPSVAGIKKMMPAHDNREMRLHQPEDFYDASFVTELDKSGYIDGLYRDAASR
jgi:NitT/TauT family transport system substrate-binding protein